MNDPVRVVLMSDLHDCHIDWYGIPTRERMERFVAQYRAYCAAYPVAHTLLLGDYSLDFWQWNTKGSWLREGVSNTAHFVRHYAARIPTPYTMIPGNHEQYGEFLFRRLTGFSRRGSIVVGGALFVLADTFSGNLDPTAHSDGTYVPADVGWIRAEMARRPGLPVFLCAHQFAYQTESEAFRQLVREEPRIIALFQGHTHECSVIDLGEEYGNKQLAQTGSFSYNRAGGFWGWRELLLTPDGAQSRYFMPENDAFLDGTPYHQPQGWQDEVSWQY